MHKNIQVIDDKVYLNGEHVADLVPGLATSNRQMFRHFLLDSGHVEAYPFSSPHSLRKGR